jgi:hypothetical protein
MKGKISGLLLQQDDPVARLEKWSKDNVALESPRIG